MWIDYPTRIAQTEDELLAVERRLRHQPTADRVTLLRLRKAGTVRSLRAAAPLLGYSEQQMQRWWHPYTARGLEALYRPPPHLGRRPRLSAEALGALKATMAGGQRARLRDAQAFLRERYGIVYHSLNGVSQLCKRHNIKWKPGRRRHRQGPPAAQAGFKQCLRDDLGAAPGAPCLCDG
jgi:transposase